MLKTAMPRIAMLLMFVGSAFAQSSILVRTDEMASVTIDGRPVGTAQPDTPLEVPVEVGQHLVTATSPAGTRFQQAVRVSPAERAIVLADLAKVRLSERKQAEQDQDREQDRLERQREREERAEEKARQDRERAQCQQDSAQLRAAYQQKAGQYNELMQQIRQSKLQVEQAKRSQANGPEWLRGLGGMVNDLSERQTAKLESIAEELKMQIDEIRSRLSELGRCSAPSYSPY